MVVYRAGVARTRHCRRSDSNSAAGRSLRWKPLSCSPARHKGAQGGETELRLWCTEPVQTTHSPPRKSIPRPEHLPMTGPRCRVRGGPKPAHSFPALRVPPMRARPNSGGVADARPHTTINLGCEHLQLTAHGLLGGRAHPKPLKPKLQDIRARATVSRTQVWLHHGASRRARDRCPPPSPPHRHGAERHDSGAAPLNGAGESKPPAQIGGPGQARSRRSEWWSSGMK
jgi:hypothetical protein